MDEKFCALEKKEQELQQLHLSLREHGSDLERLRNVLSSNEATIHVSACTWACVVQPDCGVVLDKPPCECSGCCWTEQLQGAGLPLALCEGQVPGSLKFLGWV